MKTNRLFALYAMSFWILATAYLSAKPPSAATEAYAARVRAQGEKGQAQTQRNQAKRAARAANQHAIEPTKPHKTPPKTVNWQPSPIYVSPSVHVAPPEAVNWKPGREYVVNPIETESGAIPRRQESAMPVASGGETTQEYISPPPPPPLPMEMARRDLHAQPEQNNNKPRGSQDQRRLAPSPAAPTTLQEQIRAGKTLRRVGEQPRLERRPADIGTMGEAMSNAMKERRRQMGEEPSTATDTNDAEWN